MLQLNKVKKLKQSLCFLGFLLLSGCSPEKDKPEEVDSLDIKQHVVDSSNLASETYNAENSESYENVINDAIVQYGISLSDDEKAAILEPIRESLSSKIETDHLNDLRAKIESMLNLREAQLGENPNFESLLNKQVGNTFSQADWENTVSSIPDMDALHDARRKLNDQFPASSQEAVQQAQDALFQQALTQKLRNEVTEEVVVSESEVNEFLSQYKAESNVHVLYMAKYRNLDAAALELKRDQYWNTWLTSQQN